MLHIYLYTHTHMERQRKGGEREGGSLYIEAKDRIQRFSASGVGADTSRAEDPFYCRALTIEDNKAIKPGCGKEKEKEFSTLFWHIKDQT